MKLAHSTKLSTSSLTRAVVSIAKSSHNPVIGEWRGRPAHARRPVCVVIVYYYCCAFVRDRIMCIRVRGRQLAARGHCHSSTAISAFTRRPVAEGKLLLRVYLTRPVVGHRVAQATQQSAFTLEAAKTQPNVCSKRRDSEFWTDIERQKQRLRHEI